MNEQNWITELVRAFARATDLSHEEATRYVSAAGRPHWLPRCLDGVNPDDAVRQEVSRWEIPDSE